MRTKLALLIISLLSLPSIGKSSAEIHITFSANDCINCSIGLTQLDNLPKKLDKYLILKSSDKDFFEEFIAENTAIHITEDIKVLYSDSLYRKYVKNNLSTCNIYINQKPVLIFPLAELPQRIPSINLLLQDFEKASIDTLNFDSLRLSERISIHRGGEKAFIYDYLLNKIVVLDKAEMYRKQGGAVILKPNRISKGYLMNIADLDTNAYKGTFPIFKALGKDKIRYENLFYSNDTLYALANFPYPIFQGKDTIIASFLYLAKYHNNKLCGVSYIDDSKITGKPKYYLDNTRPFFTQSGTYIFSVYTDDKISENAHFFGKWVSDTGDKQLKFVHFTGPTIPNYYVKNQEDYENMGVILRDSLLFPTDYPFIMSTSTNATWDISSEIQRVEGIKFDSRSRKKSFFLQDVLKAGDLIALLYFIDTTPRIMYYDLKEKRALLSKDLPVKKEYYLPSLTFLDYSTITVFNETRKKMLLIKSN